MQKSARSAAAADTKFVVPARADKGRLAGLITCREPPDRRAAAVEKRERDVKTIIGFPL